MGKIIIFRSSSTSVSLCSDYWRSDASQQCALPRWAVLKTVQVIAQLKSQAPIKCVPRAPPPFCSRWASAVIRLSLPSFRPCCCRHRVTLGLLARPDKSSPCRTSCQTEHRQHTEIGFRPFAFRYLRVSFRFSETTQQSKCWLHSLRFKKVAYTVL